jgi:hypothetical protein
MRIGPRWIPEAPAEASPEALLDAIEARTSAVKLAPKWLEDYDPGLKEFNQNVLADAKLTLKTEAGVELLKSLNRSGNFAYVRPLSWHPTGDTPMSDPLHDLQAARADLLRRYGVGLIPTHNGRGSSSTVYLMDSGRAFAVPTALTVAWGGGQTDPVFEEDIPTDVVLFAELTHAERAATASVIPTKNLVIKELQVMFDDPGTGDQVWAEELAVHLGNIWGLSLEPEWLPANTENDYRLQRGDVRQRISY